MIKLKQLKIILSTLVIIFAVICGTVCSQKPQVDCEEMKEQTGRKYREIYVPHEKNCNRFYQCTDHGLVELGCNKGLVFFPFINGCVVQTPDNCITHSKWKNLNL